jgi:hypothetical protein
MNEGCSVSSGVVAIFASFLTDYALCDPDNCSVLFEMRITLAIRALLMYHRLCPAAASLQKKCKQLEVDTVAVEVRDIRSSIGERGSIVGGI